MAPDRYPGLHWDASELHNPAMRDAVVPKLSKWPFLVGDALLLWTASFIYIQGKLPLTFAELALACGCIALGAIIAVIPFLLDYRALVRLAETDHVAALVSQIQDVQKIAAQISDATGRWQVVQGQSEKTAAAAKAVAERMTGELKAFSEFMQRANDSEKSTLRLEVEKLRRGESEWLQVLVRMLDHVYGLHSAGIRSGQPRVIEQLSHFQNACRDAARRVGLTPFVANPADPFDPQRHQSVDRDGQAKEPTPEASVAESVAPGYTFQGRLLRPALVRLKDAGSEEASPEPRPEAQLPLGGMPA